MRYFCCWLMVCCLGMRAAETEVAILSKLKPTHPRLILTEDSLAGMKREAALDPLRAKLHHHIVAAAEATLTEAPIVHVLVGPRLLAQSRKALAHVTTCAMAYRLNGDVRFSNHARDVMLTAAAFPDWNPAHFLDVAEMATALALGHDWLFNELTNAERGTIEAALIEKALVFAQPAYGRVDPHRESFPFVGNNLHNNWNQVCNGGFLLAALAVAEKEPALARLVIDGLRDTLPHALKAYEPDGAYPEGPVYWGYGTRYTVLILAALESALGEDFGLSKLSAFDRTALFRLHVQSPTGLSFNFADGRPNLGADSGLTWLGKRFGYAEVAAQSRASLAAELQRPPNPADRFLATHAIWFPVEVRASESLPLDVKFEGPSKLALFRSAWGDPKGLWTGLKAGSNRVNHGHLDLGSFMIDADGERWAVDLGPDDYDLPGYWDGVRVTSSRWRYFRLNNRSHNTLFPGDTLQSPDADGPIVAWGSTPERAFALADLTSAYPTKAHRFRRGVALLDRSRVLVQDEVEKPTSATPLTWQMLTGARVALDGRKANLTQNGRTLRVEILAPENARFSTKPARPPTNAEAQNDGITILSTHIETVQGRDAQVAVLLTPVGEKWPQFPPPALRPLDEWK